MKVKPGTTPQLKILKGVGLVLDAEEAELAEGWDGKTALGTAFNDAVNSKSWVLFPAACSGIYEYRFA